jgi:hypothetical protein
MLFRTYCLFCILLDGAGCFSFPAFVPLCRDVEVTAGYPMIALALLFSSKPFIFLLSWTMDALECKSNPPFAGLDYPNVRDSMDWSAWCFPGRKVWCQFIFMLPSLPTTSAFAGGCFCFVHIFRDTIFCVCYHTLTSLFCLLFSGNDETSTLRRLYMEFIT